MASYRAINTKTGGYVYFDAEPEEVMKKIREYREQEVYLSNVEQVEPERSSDDDAR